MYRVCGMDLCLGMKKCLCGQWDCSNLYFELFWRVALVSYLVLNVAYLFVVCDPCKRNCEHFMSLIQWFFWKEKPIHGLKFRARDLNWNTVVHW
jgi:hypothetical protein